MRRGLRWFLVLAAFAVLFALVAALATFSVGTGPRVPGKAVLWIRLSDVSEEDRRSSIERAFARSYLTVRDYVRLLDEAAKDRRIRAVVVELRGFGGGWAMAEELRAALRRFAETDKPIVAFLEAGGNADYFLASAADRVAMPPSGMLLVTGLLADVPFYKGTLHKLGIEADLEHIGDYKSASDVWTREGMSDAHREATNAILDGLWTSFVGGVAESRRMDGERVLAAFDEGFLTAPRAKDLGLVDDLEYADELEASLDQVAGPGHEKIKAHSYLESLGPSGSGDTIGLLYVTGTIVSGPSADDPLAGGLAGSDTIVSSLRRLRRDRSVKAVVIRVDSPGGSGLASDIIWREVELTRHDKPVVVSMGDVAASGGYYISMGADAIVAQPSTLTGSIGVILGKFSLRGLYDWAGVHREQIKRGANADLFTDYRSFSDGQRALVRTHMKRFYDDFVHKAAEGRGLSDAQIDALGQGRVWTGREAVDRKLVDEIGGLDRAVEIAREKAKIPAGRSVHFDVYPKPRSFFDTFAPSEAEDTLAGRLLRAMLPRDLRSIVARGRMAERLAAEPYLFLEESLIGAR